MGGGLEGEIPDVLARRIGEQIIRPAFRAGRFGEGLYDAGAQLLTLAGVATEEVARHARGRPRGVTGLPVGAGALLALFVVFWIVGERASAASGPGAGAAPGGAADRGSAAAAGAAAAEASAAGAGGRAAAAGFSGGGASGRW